MDGSLIRAEMLHCGTGAKTSISRSNSDSG
jgi:hypothetical protein